MRAGLLRSAALAAFAVCAAPVATAPLQPYQMIRSLQVIQDRIADGDHAALAMQRKLLEIIDRRFRTAEPADFEDDRDFRALLLYAMSGGNPTTVQVVLSKLSANGVQAEIGHGIVSYVKGSLREARDTLAAIDPMTLEPQLGASLALVKGAITAQEDPKTAARLFDQARLLSPGTLVEEAALRRSVAVYARLGETERFTRCALQYARRFLRSPYASQFTGAFVAGIVTLHETIDLSKIEEIVSGMNDEQARAIYLRLARKSAIEGYGDLLAFASARAAAFAEETDSSDPRALLYASIASVTSDNVTQVIEELNRIDRTRLSAGDRELLDAAKTIAQEVLSKPSSSIMSMAAEATSARPSAKEEAQEQVIPAAMTNPATPAKDTESGTISQTEAFVTATRDKLEEIDRLLGEGIR